MGERVEIIPGEPVPAGGDVLELTPAWWERVGRVRGRSVWLVRVSVDGGLFGVERWVVLPPARWRGPERLMRRRAK